VTGRQEIRQILQGTASQGASPDFDHDGLRGSHVL
jgi:hypothetical protein